MSCIGAVTALVVLARPLSRDPEPGGDLWPPDAQIDGMVDEHRKVRFCLVPHMPGPLDLLKQLGYGRGGDLLSRACWLGWRPLRPPRLHLLDPRSRPALRLAHELQHAAQA